MISLTGLAIIFALAALWLAVTGRLQGAVVLAVLAFVLMLIGAGYLG